MNVKEFKRHCRNRNFYMAQVCVIEEEIKQLENDYCTPRGPRLEVIGAPAHDNQSHIVDYISHKMRLEQEIDKYNNLIRMVNDISKLEKPWGEIFEKTLVKGLPVRKICSQYGISKDMYYRRLKTISQNLQGR